jgi:hypothetical protein
VIVLQRGQEGGGLTRARASESVTRLTEGHLLRGEPAPVCRYLGVQLALAHFGGLPALCRNTPYLPPLRRDIRLAWW